MCVCAGIRVFVWVCACICLCMYMCACVSACVCVSECVHVHVCIRACVCACVFMCACICICCKMAGWPIIFKGRQVWAAVQLTSVRLLCPKPTQLPLHLLGKPSWQCQDGGV